MTTHRTTSITLGRAQARGLIALALALALLVSMVIITPTQVKADAGLTPQYLGTLGGPSHSQIYSSGLETSAVDNTLVVADTGNNQIVKFDQSGNELWRIGEWGAGINQFDNPRDVAVDSVGNVFVIDTRNSRVVKLDPNGVWTDTYTGTVAKDVNFPMGGSITDDLLYLADTGRKRVRVIDTTDFSTLREIVHDDLTANDACLNFAGIRDATADSAGNVYVAGYETNEIAKIALDDTCTTWGTTGTGNGQFKTPYGVRVATDPVLGREILYVADALNFRVQTFELDGTFIDKFGVEGTPETTGTITTMRRSAVATDGSGDVWVSDLWGFKVERFERTPTGYVWAQEIGTPPGVPSDTSVFHEPREVGIGADGVLNVIDTVHHRFVRMNPLTLDAEGNVTGGGEVISVCGTRASAGAELGKFNWPRGLEVDKTTGEIWIADTKQHRIQIVDPNCTGIEFIGAGAGDGDNQFVWPYALDIRETDNIAFIADTENHRIKAYDVATRQYLGKYGSKGSNWGQMLNPQGVVVHPISGRLLISDTNNNRIKVVQTSDGVNYVTERNVDRGFDHPEGIAVDDLGRIYVADSNNNKIVIMDGTYNVIGEFSGPGFNHPAAVTVDGDLVYVSDTYNDQIHVFTWDIAVADAPAPYVGTPAGQSTAAMYPSGFEYDATNNQLVIADTGMDRILRYALDGTKLGEFGSDGGADGEFESPRDVAIDDVGNIYVADAENDRIQKFDAAGNHVWTRGTTGTCSDCLNTPIGLSWDAVNGQVLVASSAQDRIKAWDAAGVFQWVSPAVGLNGPRDAARGPDGYLWVSDYKNHRIKAFDVTPGGSWNSTPVYELGGPGDGDLNFPYNMVWDSTGNRMYVSDTGTGRVVIYDYSAGDWSFTAEWAGRCSVHPDFCVDPGAPGFEPGLFNHLRRVAIDSAGKVYGLDFWGNGIEVFNPDGTYASSIEGATAPVPGFAQPYGIDIGPDGSIYVMERLNHRIQKLDANGNYVAHKGSRATAPGTFSWPEAVAVADDGTVWAADTRGGGVQLWDANLNGSSFETEGPPGSPLNGPEGLTFYNGILYIVDTYNFRILPYNPATDTYGAAIGSFGIGDGQFNTPQGVAVDDTHMYVADSGNNRIQKLTINGTFVAQAAAGLSAPEGIALAADGTLWVADTGNGRIRHFDSDLNDLGDGFGAPGTGNGEFARPHALRYDNGFLYVADTYNHRVQKFRVGENLVNFDDTYGGEASNPAGVAPLYPGDGAHDGTNWYVADSGNSRIVRIDAARNVTVVSDVGWNDPRVVALDPDGVHLWVGDQSSGDNKVVKITKTGTVVTELRGTGLDGPWGVVADATGVYVADTYNNRVVKINATTDLEMWQTTEVGGTPLSRPRTIEIGDDGNLYIGDADNDRVVSLNPTTGAELGSFFIDRPRAIAADGSGGLWVGDARNLQLAHVQTNGTPIAAPIGGYGNGPGQFRQPSGIFMDNGDVVVSDQWSFQLQRFTVSGGAPSYAETIGGTPPSPGGFNGPFGLTYDDAGNLYVADWFNHRMQKFNPDGSFATEWGAYGSGDGGLIFPRAAIMAADGRVVVTDSENNRLSLFAADGTFDSTVVPVSTTLGRPHQTAIAADGSYWIADTLNNRLIRLDVTGFTLDVITASVVSPRGVAVDSAGNIYSANDGATDSITKYNAAGDLIGTIVTGGTAQNQVRNPHNLAVEMFGDSEMLLVADSGNNLVKFFGTSGTFSTAVGLGQLSGPKGVAVSPDEMTLAVSDHDNNRITYWDLALSGPTPPDTTEPNGEVTLPVNDEVYTAAEIAVISGTATDEVDGSGVAMVQVAIKDRNTDEWLEADGVTFSPGYKRHVTVLDAPGGVSTGWTFAWTPREGDFGIAVMATDGAGNSDSTRPWVRFSVSELPPDAVDPDATVTVPQHLQTYPLPTWTGITGNATDDVGVAEVVVAIKDRDAGTWWNGLTWQTAFVYLPTVLAAPNAVDTDWSNDWVPAGPGNYAVLVRAEDTSGNQDQTKPWVAFSLTIPTGDTVEPDATVAVPLHQATYDMATWTGFSGEATDDVGVAEVEIAIKNRLTDQYWDGTGWVTGFRYLQTVLANPGAPSTAWSLGWIPPAAGEFNILVRAEDTSGNQDQSKPWVLFYLTDQVPDTIDPNGTVIVPTNNQDFPVGPITFSGEATDNVGVSRVRIAIKDVANTLFWNGTDWQVGWIWIPGDTTLGTPGGTLTTWSYDFTPTAPGQFAISLRADDAAGNSDQTKPWVRFSVS